jgi:acyl-CoA thioesterase-1
MNNLRQYAGTLLALQLAAACTAQPAQKGAASGTAAAPAVDAVQQEPRLVLAFGDSLYAGFGLAHGQSFPAVLERELEDRGIDADVINAGISGDTTAGGLRRLPATLDRLPRKPDLAILGLGANDALLGFDPGQTQRNLEAMVRELKRRNIPVLLTGITAPPDLRHPYFSRFEAIYPEIARRHGVDLEPSLLEGVLSRPEMVLPDGVHPNAAGAARMAERVAPRAAESLVRNQSN